MSVRTERIGSAFEKEISLILMKDIKDPHIKFVTVTGCDVTNDLSYAKVYFTVLDDIKREEVIKALNKASDYIEMELSKRVDIRKMPQLRFVYDSSIEYGEHIDKIINDLHKDA